jgi:hypothetical protein
MASMITIPNARKSNWETIAFAIIRRLIGPNPQNLFLRSQLMKQKNLDAATKLLKVLGHKDHPEETENTLQKTVQNLRDKGFIKFLGSGNYKLTDEGCAELLRLQDALDKVEGILRELQTK